MGNTGYDLIFIMCYIDQSGLCMATDILYDFQNLVPVGHVQPVTGLIQEQQHRRFYYGTGDEGQFPLAVGKLIKGMPPTSSSIPRVFIHLMAVFSCSALQDRYRPIES